VRAAAEALEVLTPEDYGAPAVSVAVSHGVGVVIGDRSVNVSHRGTDRCWRFVVAVVQRPP